MAAGHVPITRSAPTKKETATRSRGVRSRLAPLGAPEKAPKKPLATWMALIAVARMPIAARTG